MGIVPAGDIKKFLCAMRMEVTMAEIKIKLVKSLSGRKADHIATANALGLRKIDDESIQPDNAQTRGKINKISYLIEVKEG